jgi:DNA-binding transcriptional ArsR family regulator
VVDVGAEHPVQFIQALVGLNRYGPLWDRWVLKTQGTISHHLRVLGEAGLVHAERRGKWVWYTLDPDRLASLRKAIGS